MDDAKRDRLIAELSVQREPHLVPIERFFDGNDDKGSIGCNLLLHPGVAKFRDILMGLLKRPDVQGVYALIAEVDPGFGSWPFTDTVLVEGAIAPEELERLLKPLKPDEVGMAETFGLAPEVLRKYRGRLLAAWWD